MQIVIIGCGKVGSNLAKVLSEEGHDVVIVDNDRSSFSMLGPDFNGVTVAGVPIDQDVLKHAGIETADALAAVTPDDNVNIMTCQVAKEFFKVPRVIARIYNPEREHVFHQFGLETICPTNLTVEEIRSAILGEEGGVCHTIGNDCFIFRQEKVTAKGAGKLLGSYKTRKDAAVFGIIQKGAFRFASPNIKLEEGNIVVIAEKANE